MAPLTQAFLLSFLIFMAICTTLNSQVEKECDYRMVVSTGQNQGPQYKLTVMLTTYKGENISTPNVVKNWGDMGQKHIYFLPDSDDSFRTQGPCYTTGFCNMFIQGKKGELKPHWFVNNVTVFTTGDGINRTKTFRFLINNEISYTNPPIDEGECP